MLASVFDDGVVGGTVDKRRADLPAFSDHPVGVGVLGEGLGEGDERDGVPLGIDLVDGQALTGVVHLEPSRENCQPFAWARRSMVRLKA